MQSTVGAAFKNVIVLLVVFETLRSRVTGIALWTKARRVPLVWYAPQHGQSEYELRRRPSFGLFL
jgi:hypothetical protein